MRQKTIRRPDSFLDEKVIATLTIFARNDSGFGMEEKEKAPGVGSGAALCEYCLKGRAL